jgi:hypothetical protein
MYKVDLSVLVGLAGRFSPIYILIPLYPGIFEVVKSTESGYGSFEIVRLILTKKG